MEALTSKYAQLKRNYDSVSLHAKKDSAQNKMILEMKENYEREINELKSAKLEAETELREVKVHLKSSEAKCNDQSSKLVQQTKEIDTLKKELARKEKSFESQLATANAGNKALYEEKGKMQAEMKKMKDELKQLYLSNTQLSEKL